MNRRVVAESAGAGPPGRKAPGMPRAGPSSGAGALGLTDTTSNRGAEACFAGATGRLCSSCPKAIALATIGVVTAVIAPAIRTVLQLAFTTTPRRFVMIGDLNRSSACQTARLSSHHLTYVTWLNRGWPARLCP